mmetsp:Transcript_7599/g.16336  ORF Transcript_7599/g.16336 Transcript_7599/m.16336 type:complete len:568 (+) Transcript_7599:131-1834(+)
MTRLLAALLALAAAQGQASRGFRGALQPFLENGQYFHIAEVLASDDPPPDEGGDKGVIEREKDAGVPEKGKDSRPKKARNYTPREDDQNRSRTDDPGGRSEKHPPPSYDRIRQFDETIGKRCDPQHPNHACGNSLVCRKKRCAMCHSSRECPQMYVCVFRYDGRNMCVKRDLREHWSHWETACSICIFFAALLSAAAGVGGGGMYVPLFLVFLGLQAQDAVPIAQALICMTAIVNYCCFSCQYHPIFEGMSKIDYNCLVMLTPMMTVGVTLGVLAHQLSPHWLIVALLVITLSIMFSRTFEKGIKVWQAESAKIAAGISLLLAAPTMDEAFYVTYVKLAYANRYQIGTVMFIWILAFASNFFTFASGPCTPEYAIQLFVVFLVFVGMTIATGYVLRGNSEPEAARGEKPVKKYVVDWAGPYIMMYPVISCIAGFLGGLVGIGGGIVFGPVLLELGLHSEAVQATSAVFVLLSSSIATVQFALLGHIMYQYVLWYGMVAVAGTILGQICTEYFLRLTGRSSIIILSIAVSLGVSMLLTAWIGVLDALRDYVTGAYMGLNVDRLCNGGH